jgi:nicotinate-nucleotide adenylyltransferase
VLAVKAVEKVDEAIVFGEKQIGQTIMRIGIFGGTFNPIHTGHIRVALRVKTAYALDKILFVPSALPPHKQPGDIVDVADRLKMLHKALLPYPDFAVSDVELKRSGPSYTIDTIRYFKHIIDDKSSLFLLLGLDAFIEIDTWKSYAELFMLIPFIVIMRTCGIKNRADDATKAIADYLTSRVSDGYQYSLSRSCFLHGEKQPVFIFDTPPIDISSTEIRRLVHKGDSIKQMVPAVVEQFIRRKGLYL